MWSKRAERSHYRPLSVSPEGRFRVFRGAVPPPHTHTSVIKTPSFLSFPTRSSVAMDEIADEAARKPHLKTTLRVPVPPRAPC